MNKIETIYATIRIDFEAPLSCDMDEDDIACEVCERANAHNHTLFDGVRIDNVEFCGINF